MRIGTTGGDEEDAAMAAFFQELTNHNGLSRSEMGLYHEGAYIVQADSVFLEGLGQITDADFMEAWGTVMPLTEFLGVGDACGEGTDGFCHGVGGGTFFGPASQGTESESRVAHRS